MTAKPDFPFYNDRPIPFEGRDWLLLMGALAVALAALTLLPLRHFPQDIVPALLFLAIPLLALRHVAEPHWTAVFRPVGLREIGLMLLFGLLTFRLSMVLAILTSGNAFAEIQRNGRGQVTGLRLMHPGAVSVERLQSGRLRYKETPGKVFLQEEVLHIRYRLAADGVMGLSPIQLGRETFSLALTQAETAAKQATKGFRPEGAVVFAQSVGGAQKTDVLEKLRQKIERNESTSGILVLDGGADWKPFAFSSKDAEFLESRKLTALDICRIFGVPPSAAGITDNATYSNIGEESRALVQRCLAPMARRIEQAMNAALLTAEGRRTFFIEHDLAGLLRGDLVSRYQAYRVGRDGGWLSPNEIRRMENLPEIEGGDEYLSPLNMQRIGDGEGE
ncbi:phage portal protein [Cereibacter johrii]|uniref:phage portal protein n=1 Tax=Cereibacter johrii TaxID=445629 RepID=UPI000DCB17A6|nr:phage portal protein [Cereibacter johrii]RAZ82029.1 phage portal protein [Cereibacter johrii]